MKIVVLAGGLSAERDVSLTSGALICRALRGLGHRAVVVDVFLGLDPAIVDLDSLFTIEDAAGEASFISDNAPELAAVKALRADSGAGLIGPRVLDICRAADIVFLGLHGEDGENGKLQAAFDVLGIKYTGSGPVGSMLAMNKMLTKKLLLADDIRTARGFLLRKGETEAARVAGQYPVPYPCMVKPCGGGSSIGLTKVYRERELAAAIELAFCYEQEIIVEEFIPGREFSVGVLDDRYLPVMELCYDSEFFDYFHKYSAGATREICPAEISTALTLAMQQTALQVHRTLGLDIYSRVDFIVDTRDRIYVLEANTLPGMTPTSIVPQEAAAAGIDYPTLCQRILDLSLRKYEE